LRGGQLVPIEPHELAGGERTSECADETGRMKADLMKAALRHRAQPRHRLDPGDIGRERLGAGTALANSYRKNGRNQAGARVNDAAEMRVVEIEPMDEYAVHDRRVAVGQPVGKADHDGLAATFREAQHCRERAAREIEAARGEGNADRIEDQVTRTCGD